MRHGGTYHSLQVTLVTSAHPEAAQSAASVASSRPSTITTSGARENGYIATLRDNFGFLMCVCPQTPCFTTWIPVGHMHGYQGCKNYVHLWRGSDRTSDSLAMAGSVIANLQPRMKNTAQTTCTRKTFEQNSARTCYLTDWGIASADIAAAS